VKTGPTPDGTPARAATSKRHWLHDRRAVSTTFWAYAAFTFTLTHWPKLKILIPINRPDIIAHIAVFGLWTMLAIRCGWFGTMASRRNLILTGLVAAVYAGVDEGLQAIPFIHRQATLDDYAANVAGVVAGALAMGTYGVFIAKRRGNLGRTRADTPTQPPPVDTLSPNEG